MSYGLRRYADQLGVSTVAVSWAVTANLLAAAAATPLIGRLADLHRKKRVLLGGLVVVLVGCLLAATTASLEWLIVARVLQAASFALYPISIAILREELRPERIGSAMAVLSGTLGFGGGAGLVAVGLLMSGTPAYHRVFWLTTAFTVVVLAIVLVVVPDRPPSTTGSIDWLGAVGLAAGLTSALLAITQGNTWGWGSPATIASTAGGRCARWFPHRVDQWPIDRPVRRSPGADGRCVGRDSRLSVHRLRALDAVAGDPRRHPGQRLHQPRLRCAAGVGGR